MPVVKRIEHADFGLLKELQRPDWADIFPPISLYINSVFCNQPTFIIE